MSAEVVFVPVVVLVESSPRMRIVNAYRPAEVVTQHSYSWTVRDMATGDLLLVPAEELEEEHE